MDSAKKKSVMWMSSRLDIPKPSLGLSAVDPSQLSFLSSSGSGSTSFAWTVRGAIRVFSLGLIWAKENFRKPLRRLNYLENIIPGQNIFFQNLKIKVKII